MGIRFTGSNHRHLGNQGRNLTHSSQSGTPGAVRPGLLLMAVAVIGCAAVTPVDYEWTLALHRVEWKPFTSFMARSLFEGEGFGGSDPGIFLIAGALGVYSLSWWRSTGGRWRRWRPAAGFVLAAGAVNGFLWVHSLKWIIGRARPSLVVDKGVAYSHWFEWGPLFITEGSYRGSLPSGHTGLVFIFMALVYILPATPSSRAQAFVVKGLLGLAVLLYAGLMAVARSMSFSHWIGDGIVTILVSWLVLHLLYSRVLRVPDQMRYVADTGSHPMVPAWWELRFCIAAAFFAAGLTGLGLGARSLLVPAPIWVPLMGVGGFLVCVGVLPFVWRFGPGTSCRYRPKGETSPPAPRA